MLIELCGNDQNKWDEVYFVGKTCLENKGEVMGCSVRSNCKKNSILHSQRMFASA